MVIYAFSYGTGFVLAYFSNKYFKFFLNLSFTFSFKVVIFQNNVVFCCIFISYESEIRLVMSCALRSHGLYSPWDPPGQNTRMGSFSLLQGIFLTQGSVRGVCNFLGSVSSQHKFEAIDDKAL